MTLTQIEKRQSAISRQLNRLDMVALPFTGSKDPVVRQRARERARELRAEYAKLGREQLNIYYQKRVDAGRDPIF